MAFLHSSEIKCFSKLWKLSDKCTWTCLQIDQKARAHHGIAVFPAQHTMAHPLPTMEKKRKIPEHSSFPSAPQPLFSSWTEVKKHMGTYPELLQLFLKWSPLQNAACFAPMHSKAVWYVTNALNMLFGGGFVNKDSGKLISSSYNCDQVFGQVTWMSWAQGRAYLTWWCLELSIEFPGQTRAGVILTS